MLPSVHALLSGIIDYAGMFPPAQLPLEQAIRNYARYRTEPESWMLGRFVCPKAQVPMLWPHVRTLFPAESEIPISTVASGLNTAAEIRAASATDIHATGAIVESFELGLSPEWLAVIAGERLPEVGPGSDLTTGLAIPEDDSPRVYFEIPRGPQWSKALKSVVDVLRESGDQRRGIKLRCGGAAAAAVPSCEDVAAAIALCRDSRVPLKFTAGLHHPIRHHDASLNAPMHGFLNVFGAGALALADALRPDQICRVLEDEDAADFVFDGEGFRWKEWRATVEQIQATRRRLVLSFGSCSFDEPRDDLWAMGLLP
jgi:hypothetical protein